MIHSFSWGVQVKGSYRSVCLTESLGYAGLNAFFGGCKLDPVSNKVDRSTNTTEKHLDSPDLQSIVTTEYHNASYKPSPLSISNGNKSDRGCIQPRYNKTSTVEGMERECQDD